MRKKILIVDDSAINRQIFSGVLCEDYDILEAENGKEAIDILKKNDKSIALILLDLIMPVMDGYQMMEQMQEDPQLSNIPIIIETVSTEEADEMKALSMGAVDFITKPCNPALMKCRVNNIISLQEAAAAANAATKDELTGAYNRNTFFNMAEKLVAEHEPGYYIMACFDIDNFKVINDQYGLEKGDEVLRFVARAFAEGFEPHGGLCGRITADNFAVLYPADFVESRRLEEIRRKINNVGGIVSPITFSIGRYLVEDLSLPASAMYDRAILAEACIKGRYDVHIAIYDESMREKLIHDQQIISEMDTALSEKQFETWFQPQYNHSTGALIGAEALVRWRHPKKGLIPPNDFIPVFEQNGFVYEVDKFVWEDACRYLRKWTDEGRSPLPISVNISRYDIFRADLIDVITGLIKKYDLSVDLLRLEITESAFAESTEHIVNVVKQLIKYGFTVEIDDFGSGYSSLNTLKSVPAQVVKLDMRFLEGDDDSQRGGNIIQSIVRMTKWLGMSVIAEGVETSEDADFLKSIGCSYVQGYLYARPMPAAEYEMLAKETAKEGNLLVMETVNNLDNNSFWDPKSMDTLIFNSYVGGACIFEYHEGNIELLRATDKYAQVIGSSGMDVKNALKINWGEHLDKETAAEVGNALKKSIETKDEVTCELLFLDLPGCPHETYLRSAVRVIASAGEHYLVYCTNENITAQREAENNERKASERAQAIMDDVGSGITAGIIRNGNVEFLFVNDKFFEILGFTREQYDEEVANIFDILHPDDRERIQQIAGDAYRQEKSDVLEYRIINRSGEERWLRAIISATKFIGVEENVQLGIFTDITAEKQAEQELHNTDEQLVFLNEAAHAVLAQSDSNKAIDDILQKLRDYFNGNRAYVFEFDYEKSIIKNTYEVCAAGVSCEKDNLQSVPIEAAAFWLHTFEQQSYINIVDVDEIEDTRAEERQTLKEQGIKSLIAVPLRRDGKLIGMVGIDDPQQSRLRIDRLVALGDYIAVLLTRRDLNEQINSDNRALEGLMNGIPGGFVRMRIKADGNIVPIYFNEGFYRLVGMDREQLMDLYSRDIYAGVHPDDVDTARETIEHMIAGGEARSAKYRLRHGDGKYIWLMVFGRCRKDESGKIYLNIYYTDATEQNKIEEQQKELLDNLPCGAALYEYDGKSLTVVHLNKRYWELVGREPVEYTDNSVLTAVHPEDRKIIAQELAYAVRRNFDASCDVRVLCEENQYKPFHITGRIISKPDGRYAIYASYTPILDEAMSYQEMLPIALSTVISSSSDIAFVKDKDFRYICCSPALVQIAGVKDEKDVIGKTDYELINREYAGKYRADEEQIAKTGQAHLDFEEVLPTKDASIRYGNTSKYPLMDFDGNVIGIYGITRDVTAYHTAYGQLKLLTDSIMGGIATYLYSSEGIKISYFNEGFCKIFDINREEYERISAEDPFIGIFAEDAPALQEQLDELVKKDIQVDCIYRVHLRNGEQKWINLRAVASDRHDGIITINAVLFDVTEQQDALEKLSISEEESHLAMQHSGNTICRYNVADKTVTLLPEVAATFSMPEKIQGVPYESVKQGVISEESKQAYIEFYEGILNGQRAGTAVFQRKFTEGMLWIRARYSTIFSNAGKPVAAILSFSNITEQLEKETVFKKWQQSLQDKGEGSYTLFRCNISQNTSFDSAEGTLLHIESKDGSLTFDEWTVEYAEQCVYKEDRERYIDFLRSEALIATYYRGKRSRILEYRENLTDGSARWLRLTVDLVEYPNSRDIAAYMLYENIDDSKRAELLNLERAETDPLTGILNRAVFTERVGRLISASKPGTNHALMMLDVDGFKLINDVFGHGAGDKTIINIAEALKTILRREDLLGRLGGDEFVVFLSDIPNDAVAAAKAKQMCSLIRKSLSMEVQISGSIGIAMCPRDGTDFETLYSKVDAALYYVKGSGKDNYAFYHDDMEDEHLDFDHSSIINGIDAESGKKRRMLIVDDNVVDNKMLNNIFKDDFIVEKARDGNSALIRLRHYGTAISVVLLDLMMPGMDGLEVMKMMQQSVELRNIPVIIVSSDDHRETALKVIRHGATDFVTKPVDPELLRIRVYSAISKAENERLRAKNSFLELQNDETTRYKTVVERTGTVVVEYDWVKESFTYDSFISHYIAGVYNDRMLWRILLSDMVTDTQTVEMMQELVGEIANDREKSDGHMIVQLKTPTGDKHHFSMNVYKLSDEFGMTEKIYITFNDTEGESTCKK